MNLKLVIFDLDNTQFLVDGKNIFEAIDLAIDANKSLGGLSDSAEFGGPTKEEVEDIKNYTVEGITDMKSLADICTRNDYFGVVNGVIVFEG